MEAPVLTSMLRRGNPAIEIRPVHALAELAAWTEPLSDTRLVSFCSSVIVPAQFLSRLGRPAYNFHPGPPERPGRYPAVFALYERAQRFGVTVHEMLPLVDSGPIVTVERFAIPNPCDLAALEELTLKHLAEVFSRLVPYLTNAEVPLPQLPIAWSGRKTTKADCDALCAISSDMGEDEIALRRRSCGVLVGR